MDWTGTGVFMSLDRMIISALRAALRGALWRGVEKGIDRGVDHFAAKGQTSAPDAQRTQQTKVRMRQATRIMRRFMRF